LVQESRLIVIVLSIILLVSVFPSAIPRFAYGNFGICSYSIDYLSGPAPLTVTLSNIHITTGGEHYNTGTVTFWYSINGQWYQHYTAPVEGPIATAPDKSLTFTEPGQYEITMRCEHSSGEVIDSPYINTVMVGAGGSSPEPPPEPDSYECYSQFQDGFCWEATYENAEDYATVRIDGVIQYDKLVYEVTGDGDVTAWFSLLDDLSQIPERYCDIETCTGLPNIRSIPNQGEITLNRDGYYTIVGHSVSSQYAWVYTNVHWPFEEPEEFDFVVSANPASLSVTQGNRASYDITVSLIGGEPQQVDLHSSFTLTLTVLGFQEHIGSL